MRYLQRKDGLKKNVFLQWTVPNRIQNSLIEENSLNRRKFFRKFVGVTLLAHLPTTSFFPSATENLKGLIQKLESCHSVDDVLEKDPLNEAYWSLISASHWPMNKVVTRNDVPLLIQHLVENEIILSRKYEIDKIGEGLALLGLLPLMRDNPELCFSLLCYTTNQRLSSAKLKSFIFAHPPAEFSRKQSYTWFMEYIDEADEDKLVNLLQFVTGYKSVPPRGLPNKISITYLPEDNEEANMPEAASCLSIIRLPTVISSRTKFFQVFDAALKHGCQGFGSG